MIYRRKKTLLLGTNQHLEASGREKSQKMDCQVDVSASSRELSVSGLHNRTWNQVSLLEVQRIGGSTKLELGGKGSLLSAEIFLPRQGVYHTELNRTLLTELQAQPKCGVPFHSRLELTAPSFCLL